MKFAHKLTLAIVLPLCVALSVGGTWSIHQNFLEALDTAARTNSSAQMRQRYALENELADVQGDSANEIYTRLCTYEQEQRTLGEEGLLFTVMGENGAALYSTMPLDIPYREQQQAVTTGEDRVFYVDTGATKYQLLTTPLRGLSRTMWLVNVYDVTAQFAERDRQVRQHLTLEGVALLLTRAAAALMARLLTRPLHQLELASRALSSGEQSARADIHSGDELEQLGLTFNHMADNLTSQMQALEEESARQKRFVAAFTHELKTPMTAILGYADLLRKGEQAADKRHRAAAYIYQEASRLETLGQELLQLFGLEQGGITREPVQLSMVWGDVIRSLPDLAGRLTVEGQDPTLRVNRPLLGTLLRNLVLNAAAADTQGGNIRLWCDQRDGVLCLGVTDTGPGIPAEELEKLREPFYRLDKSRSRQNGGNGLGLTICERVAQAHGTTLRMESEVGKGTTVWIPWEEAEPCV